VEIIEMNDYVGDFFKDLIMENERKKKTCLLDFGIGWLNDASIDKTWKVNGKTQLL
jgi:hypothetical protein